MEQDNQTTRLQIVGMSCASCVSRLEKVLARQKGAISVSVNLASESAHILHAPDWDVQTSIAAIRKAGFDAHQPEATSPADGGQDLAADDHRRQTRWVLVSLAAACCLMAPMLLPPGLIPGHTGRWPAWLEFVISTPVQWLAGAGFVRGAMGALRNRQANMDVLVLLGSFTAWAYSTALWLTGRTDHLFFEAGVAIIAFVLLGKWLEKRAREQTTAAMAGLQTLRPEVVEVIIGDTPRTIPLAQAQPGDVLRVSAGQRVPCDGLVLSGRSHLDESALTGESMPVSKQSGDTVRAGSLNLDGELRFEVQAVGKHTLLGQVIDLIESAQGQKLPVQLAVDRVAAVFVPVVLLIAALTGLTWALMGAGTSAALMHAVTVVVVACPCALGLATPAAIMAGTGAAARAGLLIRDPRALHVARHIDTVVFDKTGTLTQGKPRLVNITVTADTTADQALALAAGLQMRKGHPLGDALLQAADARALPTAALLERQLLPGIGTQGRLDAGHPTHPGQTLLICHAAHALTLLSAAEAETLQGWLQGKQASANTLSVLLCGQHLMALIEFADPVRPEAHAALNVLRSRGMRLLLLSGDRPETVRQLVADLPIDEAHGHCTPADKARWINTLKAAGHRMAMVGDGVNDAPAMALADLAIAMAGGTDLAAQTAHVTLMRADLRGVAQTLEVAEKIHRNIKENLFWAFAYNVVCIPLAALGWFNPMMASAAMALSSVSVVGNALRLTRWTPA